MCFSEAVECCESGTGMNDEHHGRDSAAAGETRRLKVALNAGRESNLQHPHNNKVLGLDLITQQ